MANEQLFRTRRSRGLNSIIEGKKLDEFLRKAIKDEMEPFAIKEYEKYTKDWKVKPRFYVPTPRVGRTGQFISVRLKGETQANKRWLMVDTEGRKGGKIIKSTKFKTVRRKTAPTKIIQRANRSRKKTNVIKKGGTYKRPVPMPLPKWDSITNEAGQLASGKGGYLDYTGATWRYPKRDEVIFRTKVELGHVTPAHISRDYIAPVLRKEMTRVVENAYRRAFRAIMGRGI